MKSDPHERTRRLAQGASPTGSGFAGLLGVSLLIAPFGLAGHSLAAAQLDSSVTFGIEIIAAFIGIIGLNAIFVAAETAIDLLRPMHLKILEVDERRERILKDLIERKSHYVAASFLGSQTMRAWMMLLCVLPAVPVAISLGMVVPTGGEGELTLGDIPAILLVAIGISIPVAAVNVVIGELIPKSYSAAHPTLTALRLYRFVRVFAVIFSGPGKLATAVAGLVTKRFGARATFAVANQAEEEIKTLLESYEETGEIEVEEKAMLHSVFEFGDTVAREIMTPRVDLDSVSVDTPLDELARLVEESGHSRIPVYEGTDDQILGIVHAKDILSELVKGNGRGSARDLMRPAFFVPENKNLHDLLHEMRIAKTQMVIVQDEFGGTAGVVTIEDMVEEVVGEIVDEYDVEEPEIVPTDGGYVVDGKLHLDDLNREVGTEIESEEFDTIGGYVFGLFGRQPTQGEEVESEGHLFRVEQTDGRRIMRIRVQSAHRHERERQTT